ncbi:MAG: nuclear transport factor 2 family protein [Lautropia sp.]
MTDHTPDDYEALIRRYFDACNAADLPGLMRCFTDDAVHYFPPGLPDIPWIGAETISRKWIWCVRNLGSQWTIERILVSHDKPEAMIEWTHWKNASGTAVRGAEWYVFRDGRISEIRAYYAAAADPAAPINELPGFDYPGRGYHLRSAGTAGTPA